MRQPVGAWSAKNSRCSLENSLRRGRSPAIASPHGVSASRALERRRAHVSAGHRVDLDDEVGRLAQLAELGRYDRAKLDDRGVARGPGPPARTTTPAWFSVEVGSVEEEDLADLGLERVESEGGAVDRYSCPAR